MRLFLMIALCVVCFGFKPVKQNIKGQISTPNSGKVTLLCGSDTVSIIPIKNGNFKLKASFAVPAVVTLAWGKEKNQKTVIFLEGSDVSIAVTEQGAVVKGGVLQSEWALFMQQERDFTARRTQIIKEYEKAVAAKNLFSSRVIWAQEVTLGEKFNEIEDDFIRRNDNLFGAYLIKRRVRELVKEKKMAYKYELLGEVGRNTAVGKELLPFYKSTQQMKVGYIAPNFTLSSLDGKDVTLYDVKGKVKIIDFWASWCGPCRAANPDVLALYEKYHAKGLEIIGVSLDGNKEKWAAAVAADKLPWIHVSSLQDWSCPVGVKYGIKAVPTVIVLDENNLIVSIKPSKKEMENIISKMLD